MLEVQAQLTKDPNDKDNFHRKQQSAVIGSKEVRRTRDSKESANLHATLPSALNLESRAGPVPRPNTAVPILDWANIDAETCMAILGNKISAYGIGGASEKTIKIFKDCMKPVPRIVSFAERFKRILRGAQA